MEDEFIGAIKIKDALFIGDKESSQDLDFLFSSKVTHIINTASLEVKDEWCSIGIFYLSLPLQDSETQPLEISIFTSTYSFIEESLAQGESVLIHSVKGQSRCALIVLSYLMQKYSWSLSKSLEFLNSRKPDCEIRSNFLKHLVLLEQYLVQNCSLVLSKTWDLTDNAEEVLLRNTYLNSRPGEFVLSDRVKGLKQTKIRWLDELTEVKRPKSRSFKKLKNSIKLDTNKKTLRDSLLTNLKGSNSDLREFKPPCSTSKSMNNLSIKNFSSTAKTDDDKKRTLRTSSVSKRENSPRIKDLKKVEGKGLDKKKPPCPFAPIDPNKMAKNLLVTRPRSGSQRRSSPLIRKEQIENRNVLKQVWRV